VKIRNTLALLTLLQRYETWAIREQDKSRISVTMDFMRKAKNTWQDHETNGDILSELKINPVVQKIKNYRNKRTQHVWQMDRYRLPHLIMKHPSSGK
jgi:mevalonate kinase